MEKAQLQHGIDERPNMNPQSIDEMNEAFKKDLQEYEHNVTKQRRRTIDIQQVTETNLFPGCQLVIYLIRFNLKCLNKTHDCYNIR